MGTTLLTTETKGLQHSTSCFPNGTDKKPATNGTAASNDWQFQRTIVWRNVIIFLYVHLAALYGLYLTFFKIKVLTVIWGEYLHLATMILPLQVDGRPKCVYRL
jgi:hypothetical protein